MSDNILKAQANKLKKGDLVVLKGMACKIQESSHCKTGKHGSGRNSWITVGLFDGKKYEGSSPAKGLVDIPVVTTQKYNVTDISKEGDELDISVMDEKFEEHPSFIQTKDADIINRLTKLFDDAEGDIVVYIQSWDKYRQVSDVKEEN